MANDTEKLSWIISDISILLLLADQINVIDLSGNISIQFLEIATYTELVIIIGGVAALVSIVYKLT